MRTLGSSAPVPTRAPPRRQLPIRRNRHAADPFRHRTGQRAAGPLPPWRRARDGTLNRPRWSGYHLAATVRLAWRSAPGRGGACRPADCAALSVPAQRCGPHHRLKLSWRTAGPECCRHHLTTFGCSFAATTDRADDMVLTMINRGCRAIRHLENNRARNEAGLSRSCSTGASLLFGPVLLAHAPRRGVRRRGRAGGHVNGDRLAKAGEGIVDVEVGPEATLGVEAP
jgi:hypothetical protein